jgi:methylenetetrahydrofolate dehydrogenase(NAD+)/5,10-methenyltetrahydrofolate cyclohydrolase
LNYETTFYFRLRAQIIDGAKIAQDIRQELKVEVDEWVARGNRRPHLIALLVGEDPASATYVKNKMQAAREIGKTSIVIAD